MNSRAFLPLLLLATFSCQKIDEQKSAQSSPGPSLIAKAPAPAVPRPGQKEHHRLAPVGVFFLMERVALITDSGVIGFAPGTRVRLIKDKGETFLVTDSTTNFDVSPDKLTDDIDLGALAAKNDAASQQALAEFVRQQYEAEQRARQENTAMLDRQQHDVDVNRAAQAAAAPRNSGKLDRGAYNQTYTYPYPYWYHRHWIYRPNP